MRTKLIAMMLLATMALSLLPSSLSFMRTVYADATTCEDTVGGTWSADEWCEIDEGEELDKIRTNADTLSGSYRLTANLDLSAYGNWERIGDSTNPFKGGFDGNGYTIRNLKMDSGANDVGFFGMVSEATIQSARLVNVDVSAVSYVGGLAGYAERSTIIRSSVEGVVTGGKSVGGLVGYSSFTTIVDSYTHGEVRAASSPVDSFGGLVGYNTGTITGSYTTVKVDSVDLAGGLVGKNENRPITESYWNRDTSGVAVSDGGIELITAEMKTKATYLDHLSTPHIAWDFSSADPTWGMIERVTYPLHYGDYKKVALKSLEVRDEDGGGSSLVWDRAFAVDYGVYTLRAVNRTDTVEISAEAPDAGSEIAFYTGTDLSMPITDADGDHVVTVPLSEGDNAIGIQVTGDNGLDAMYRLAVIRDSGALDNPHRITTADDLASIGSGGYEMDDHYVLEADIDLAAYGTGEGWSPIGSAADPFEGSFNGNHHSIRNLTIDRPGQQAVGLFGSAGNASITNVSLLGADVRGGDHVGGLIGSAAPNAGGDTLAVSRVVVQGAVHGDGQVGGLIGSSSSTLDIDESYSAAVVAGDSAAGGLIGSHTGTGSVSDSFWDIGASGQATSSGGGSGKTTADMLKPETYNDAGWTFGAGGWGMIEDTTYPMPYDRVQGVWLNNVSIMIAGENKSLSFDRNAGYYALVLDAPAPEASVLVVPNDAGAAIEIDGQAGVAGNVDLNFGVDNMVEMRVTGAGGWQGLYRLAITVPVPKPLALEVPGNATYGIGDQLDFTVTYDYAVEADEDNPPALPILLDGGEELAVYSGQPVGEPEKLTFRYTVLEGDEGVRGIQLGDALVSSSPSAIVGAGDPAAASMELPGVLPVTSGVVIDGIKPSITLTPSTTSSTRNPVTVEADVDGTGSAIDELKFGEGIRDISYFADSGTPISGGEFVATDNGNYTVYARDSAGNEQVEIVAIANIVTANPTVLLDYSPKTPTRGPVDVAVTVTVSDVAGNKLEQLKWAAGELAADDFSADPTLGADAVGGLFSVSANGDYTVYAIDSAGNEQVETIGIANITTTNPTILLDYSPKMPTNSQIEVTVTASVYEAADNKLEVLKWAAGELEVGDFNADPTLGADVTGSLFSLSENGEYTVYAVDSAGNEQVETIEVSNIVTAKPMILLDYSPMTPTRGMVDVGVTASVTDAAGNKLEELRWAAGERNAGDFSADPTLGAEVAGGLFSVSANGKYTVYAVDTAGNEQTETIEINHIDNSVPVIIPNMRQFLIDPNRDNTVSFDGLTLFIPAGAVDQFTYITVENVTDAAKRLMKEDQKLLGKGYKLTKNTKGHFKLPITLSMEWTGEELGIDQRPVVAYYDEAAKQWVALKGKREGSLLAGETDHFTVFAAITADADRPAISDINGHWGEKSIREAVETGLVDGYPDGAFRPDQQVTRAEFATMLHRMFAWPNGPDAGFNDQSEILPWAREAVSAAVKAGVVSGYPDGTFRPAADVNRVEAVVMTAKAAGLQADKNVLAPFADDAAIAAWAKPYIDAAHEAGLVEGQSGNRFNPQAAMTRAEAVVLLLRLADYR